MLNMGNIDQQIMQQLLQDSVLYTPGKYRVE